MLIFFLFTTNRLIAQTTHTLSHSEPTGLLTVTATTVNPTCATQVQPTSSSMLGNGSLTATATGGTPPYTYALVLTRPSQSSGFFPGLDFGNYEVMVTDATGATASANVFLSYTLPQPLLDINILQIPASCTSTDGSINLVASGGTPPYTYSTDGAQTFHTSASVTGLEQGYEYVFFLKDANGCLAASGTSGASFTSHYFMCSFCCELQLSGLVTKEACTNDGEISMGVNNAAGPIYYSLDAVNYTVGNGFNGNATVFSNLTPGVYNVYAKNDLGYTGQASFTVSKACSTSSLYPQLSATFTPEQCGGGDAVITLYGAGGSSPYLYSIDGINFFTAHVFSGLSAGNYTATLKDATGTTATVTVAVTGTVRPVITSFNLPPFCENATGQLSLVANSIPPFQFSLDNGLTFQSSNTFTNIKAGTYSVLVEDASGCSAITEPTAVVYPVTPVYLGNDTNLCAGQSLFLSAPSSPLYQYQWQDNSTLDHYDVTQPGSFWVKLTNENNCSTADSIQVTYTALPVFTLGPDTTLCTGAVLRLNPSIAGNFLWSDGTQGPFFTITNAGLYWLQETNQHCITRDSILVTFNPKPVIQLGDDTSLCAGDQLLLNVTNPGAVYQWQDGSSNATYTIQSPGIYSVKVSLGGCDTSGTIKVDYLQKPDPPFAGDTTVCITQQLLLNAFSQGASYLWQDGSTQPDYTVTQAGNYSVHLSNVCGSADASLAVKYDNCNCNFYVPNAFTPNHDGINDVFRARYSCLFDHFDMKIFNRWGQLVFHSANAGNGWDGTLNGLPQVEGGYIWMISYHDQLTNRNLQKKGTLILTR